MIHVTRGELAELEASLATLETVLEKLDDIGAGIAAIHIDAAINQLKNNIEVIGLNQSDPHAIHAQCSSETPPFLG